MTTTLQTPTTKRAPMDSMRKSDVTIAHLHAARGHGRIRSAAATAICAVLGGTGLLSTPVASASRPRRAPLGRPASTARALNHPSGDLVRARARVRSGAGR